jgi:SAM-dependent methyltransferase
MCADLPPVPPADHWSRVDYRRLIAWPERMRREWPFIEATLGAQRPGLVLDLGCGTGEHSRELASHGFDVIGIDSSPAMLARAADRPVPPNLRFVEGELPDVASLVDRPARGAICLGNTMPHLDDAAMGRFSRALATVLEPGAPFLFQVLNYERIRAARVRHLPLNFVKDDDGSEVIFLRLMDTRDNGTVVFSPTTLRYRPDAEAPVEVLSTRSVTLRAWTWEELRAILHEAGFSAVEAYGGYDRKPFDPVQSPDIVGIARR